MRTQTGLSRIETFEPSLDAAATGAPARPSTARWRVVLGVFKLRIGVLIMLTALAGLAIVPGASASAQQIVVLALAVLTASAAAGAFNQYFEADSDRRMTRTRSRAFASGALSRGLVWPGVMLGMLAAAIAAAAWWLNVTAAAFVLLGALTYALLYTVVLKRRTSWNIVIGGLAGSFAVLAGSAAAGNPFAAPALLLALVLFLWTPPHFWSLAIATRDQYAAAGIPMLPVVLGPARAARIVHYSTLALVAASLLPLACGAGWAYGIGAVAGSTHFLRKTRALAHEPTREHAMASFFASMTQLSALILGIWIDAALR